MHMNLPGPDRFDAPAHSGPGVVEELPMTPAMRACLGVTRAGGGTPMRRRLATFIGVAVVALLLLRVGFWPSVFDNATNMIVGGLIAIGAAIAAEAWPRVQAHRDLAKGTFARYQGPFELSRRVVRRDLSRPMAGLPGSDDSDVYWSLVLPGGSLDLTSREAGILDAAGGGAVDFAASHGLVFEIRDSRGQVVYRADGYDP